MSTARHGPHRSGWGPPHSSVVWMLALLVGCESDFGTGPGPRDGTVVVSLTTVGVELDSDGFVLRLDGFEPQDVGVDGTATFSGVRAGAVDLAIEGVAPTCDPEGGMARRVDVPVNRTVEVLWSVVCTAKPIVFSSYRNASREPRLFRMNEDGTGARQLGTAVGVSPRWSPDGTRILFEDEGRLFVMAPDGSQVRSLGDGVDGNWSPDGTRIAFSTTDDWGFPTFLQTMRADGTDRRLVSSDGVYHPDWGPDGRIVAVEHSGELQFEGDPDPEHYLVVFAPDGSGYERIFARRGWISRPVWSPDGTRIAFAMRSGAALAIFTVGSDGDNLRQRTAPTAAEEEPRWFGDGVTLLFTAYTDSERVRSELRRGSHDTDSSTRVTHFSVLRDRGGDVRRSP